MGQRINMKVMNAVNHVLYECMNAVNLYESG